MMSLALRFSSRAQVFNRIQSTSQLQFSSRAQVFNRIQSTSQLQFSSRVQFSSRPHVSIVVRFPDQNAIQAYLEKHPLTRDPWLKEMKVLEVAAKSFANSDKAPMGIQMGVTLMLHDLGGVVPEQAMMPITLNLVQALQDCAEGKEIKKPESKE